MDYQDYQYNRALLRSMVRSRVSFQSERKAINNRLGVKAAKVNGENVPQNLKEDRDRKFGEDAVMLKEISGFAGHFEKEVEKKLLKILKRFDIYNQWLDKQKGVGTIASAWILGEFDIYKADTVSSMRQFAGLNSGEVRGQISVKKEKYKPEMGEVVRELPAFRDGEARLCVLTNRLIRGDKMAEGFLSPFNKKLKTALCGVMGDGFIKCQNDYALNFYYPEKNRLENSANIVKEMKKGGKVVEIPWSDATPMHRHRAAIRKMVKAFIKDLYLAWRTMEGLPVRKPYAEEYLGRKHNVVDFGKVKAGKAKGIEKTSTIERASNLEKTMKDERIMRKRKTKAQK